MALSQVQSLDNEYYQIVEEFLKYKKNWYLKDIQFNHAVGEVSTMSLTAFFMKEDEELFDKIRHNMELEKNERK